MKNLQDCLKKSWGRNLFLLLLLLLLAACGGGEADEAVEEVTDSGASEITDSSDSEAIEDGNIGATGSEEDSGELPPTPQPGSKTETLRATPDPTGANLAAADPASITNRGETGETAVSPPLDLVLLIDVTGSMADELAQLQASLPDLMNSLATSPQATNVRLGMVAYRDQAKQDAVQLFEFTEDTAVFANHVAGLTAVGGGDYPEALHEGLDRAITDLHWRPEATKLLIILGDAPPQANNNDTPSITETSEFATAQNISIFTIGSDGLNAAGALTYAQIAQAGNGRFYFISDSPENNNSDATAVYATAQLTTLFLEIIQEAINEQAP